ncbi:MAG: TRAP transporter substrate-binding protein [Alphaproteobacteria bacterium]|nr:TRAP transporter substrate-binding protein [Alphaproteobacteria bacterium]
MRLSRRTLVQALVGLAAACRLGLVGKALAQDFTMKLTTSASNDLDTEWFALLKAGVEQASQGRIRANVFPASQLGSGPTVIEGVAMGTIEVTMNASGLYEGLEPRFAVFSVPGVFGSMRQGAQMLIDADVRQRLATMAHGKGVEVLTALVVSPAGIVSRRPLAALGDFQGMKIRVPGSVVLSEQLKQLGAAPISMALGEALPAFQNGTIDGVYAATNIFSALKYYDIAKNLIELPESYLVIVGLANSAFLQSLGPLEAVVREAAHKADIDGAAWGESDVTNARARWHDNGGKIFALAEYDARRFLEITVPTALRYLNMDAQADYAVLKQAAARYS